MPTIISGNQTYSNSSLAMNDNTTAAVTGDSNTIAIGNNDNLTVNGNNNAVTASGTVFSRIYLNGTDSVNVTDNTLVGIYGNNDTITMGNNDNVSVTGNGNVVNANSTTGTQGHLYFTGNNTLNLGTSAKLTLSANSDTVNVASNATITVIGSSNTVNATGTSVTSHIYLSSNTVNVVDNGKTSIGGNSDLINVGNNANVYVTGNSSTINATGTTTASHLYITGNDTINVIDNGTTVVAGNGDTVNLRNSGTVTVTGNSNTIAVESNNALTITGNSNTINANTTTHVYVDGTDIRWVGNNELYTGDGNGFYDAGDGTYAHDAANNAITVSGGGNTINAQSTSQQVYFSSGNYYYSGNNALVTSPTFSFGSGSATIAGSIFTGADGNLYVAKQNSEQISVSNTNGTADTINIDGALPTAANSNAGVTLADNVQVNLNGGGNRIILGNNDTLTVSSGLSGNNAIIGGNNNTISLTGSANGVADSYSTINIQDYTLPTGAVNPGAPWQSADSVVGTHNAITVNANNNVLVVVGGNTDTIVVNGNNDLEIYNGNNATITLNGSNDSVTVRGSGNTVNATNDKVDIDSANTLTVNGDGNTFIGAANSQIINNLSNGTSVVYSWDANDAQTCVSYSGANGTGTVTGAAADPIILNLLGQTVQTQSLTNSQAYFDVENNGQSVHTAWAGAGEGFLVYNPANPDGPVTQDSQLVSSFAALNKLDSNGDGILSSLDTAAWQDLRVWVTDGTATGGSLDTLDQLGISSINLNAKATNTISNGNTIIADSSFSWADGRTGDIAGVALAYQPSINQLVSALASFAPATATTSSALAANDTLTQPQLLAAAH